MRDSEDIRGLLTRAEVPPAHVDLDAILTDGHRRLARRRTARVVGGVALAIVLLTATSLLALRTGNRLPPATPGTCTVHPLPVPSGLGNVTASGVDPTGRYIIGGSYIRPLDTVAVLWTDGVPAVLPIRAESASIDGINAHGVGVGLIQDNDHRSTTVFRYQDGVVTKLRSPVPDTWDYSPRPFINEAGLIVVNAQPRYTPGESVVIAWAPGALSGHLVNVPSNNEVIGISEDHLLVEDSRGGGGHDAYVTDLDGGRPRRLAVPDGMVSHAYAISGDWVVGDYTDQQGQHSVGIRWNLRTGRSDRPGGDAIGMFTVNAKGWTVYGTPLDPTGLTALGDAVDKLGTSVTMPQLPDMGERGISLPAAIADDGTVVGYADDGHEHYRPVIWHC